LGENLGRALIANQGWLADGNLISRVLQRCVGKQMCDQLTQIATSATPPYHVTLYRSGTTENHQVAQYSEKSLKLLSEKIGQFPKGTVFALIPNSPQNGDQRALEREARDCVHTERHETPGRPLNRVITGSWTTVGYSYLVPFDWWSKFSRLLGPPRGYVLIAILISALLPIFLPQSTAQEPH